MKAFPVLALLLLGGGTVVAAPQKGRAADTSRMAGKVIDAVDGKPIPQATVRLRLVSAGFASGPDSPHSAYETESDADGIFAVANIQPGVYRVFADSSGYVRRFYNSRPVGPDSPGEQLRVEPGKTIAGLDIRLTRQGRIAGQVLDENGMPLAHVHVGAQRAFYDNGYRILLPMSFAETDLDGVYYLSALPPGKYYICAEDRDTGSISGLQGGGIPEGLRRESGGNVLQRTWYPNAVSTDAAVPVSVESGADVRGIVIRPRREKVFRVRGEVSWPGDKAPERPPVLSLTPFGYDLTGSVQALKAIVRRDTGAFMFEEVRPGRYYVEPARTGINSFFADVAFAGVTELVVKDEDVADLKLSLGFAPDLYGTIRVEGDEALPTATGAAVSPPAKPGNAAKPKVSVVPPPPGTKGLPRKAEESPAPAAQDLPMPTSGPPSSSELSIRLESVDRLTLNPPSVAARPGGSFKLPSVPADRYSVTVAGLSEDTYIASIRLGGHNLPGAVLDLRSGATGSLDILLRRSAAEWSGTAKDRNGKGIPDLLVSVWSADGDIPGQGAKALTELTDGNGHFRFAGLAPGNYLGVAWEDVGHDLAKAAAFCRLFAADATKAELIEKGKKSLNVPVVPRTEIEKALSYFR
jgi:hypothetical protein